jgi:hypothetical protein
MAKRKPLDAAGWQSATSVYALLRDLQQHHGAGRTPGDRRRLRLFACAACRQVWRVFVDDDSRRAVEVAERFADVSAGREELDCARRSAEAAERRAMEHITRLTGGRGWQGPLPAELAAAQQARGTAAAAAAAAAPHGLHRAAETAALQAQLAAGAAQDPQLEGQRAAAATEGGQCALVRDIFGDPFRRVAVPPGWFAQLAESAYQARQLPAGHLNPVRLAALADALEESGDVEPEVLAHLRSPGPHVRGCWVIDALTGRS